MSPTELLAHARSLGHTLRVQEPGTLLVSPRPAPDLRAALVAAKPALLELLRAESAAAFDHNGHPCQDCGRRGSEL